MAHLIAFGDEGDALPGEVKRWLRAGFRRYLSGAAPSLEIALQLGASNRKRVRDQALREAADVIDNGQQLPHCTLAKMLEEKIERFESGVLPLIKRGMPSNLTVLDQCLWQAFRAGGGMRRSKRDLQRLWTNA